MKIFILSSLLLTSTAFADLAQEEMDTMVAAVASFKTECLDTNTVTEVKEITVSNKTSESIDKKQLSDAIAKAVGLKINAKSKYTLKAVLNSTSTEVQKVRTTKYALDLGLLSPKELCKKTYSHEVTEERE